MGAGASTDMVRSFGEDRVKSVFMLFGLGEYIPLVGEHKLNGRKLVNMEPQEFEALGIDKASVEKLHNLREWMLNARGGGNEVSAPPCGGWAKRRRGGKANAQHARARTHPRTRTRAHTFPPPFSPLPSWGCRGRSRSAARPCACCRPSATRRRGCGTG
jgi:hypothetical protein